MDLGCVKGTVILLGIFPTLDSLAHLPVMCMYSQVAKTANVGLGVYHKAASEIR